ncbi:D-cysteine desulfhydrase [Asanoa hainanensis]|uniref:D-cysteine desulfhydrase n=1 Tax=Asanoa hainanensis TaxID=560556 RepID=A0A239GPV5_9ACTN|nr:pyridoxal-phosphate dependent enzyme [Asanoa hainanensis]SNS71239.1 D-cysteine desulfhydrase [Asanoa hainanensis]
MKARRRLAVLPTPLHRLPALERKLGTGPLHLKRDDLTGFGVAGNKARPLEFLLGDALARGADTLVTAGAPSSNFIAAAALAARVCGLRCDILVAGAPTPVELASRSGARLLFTGADRDDLDRLVDEHAAKLRAEGRDPYPVPRGGATPVGALGFAAAAEELADQLAGDATVLIPTGSGASLAGFLAGQAAIGASWRTYGVSVSRPADRMRAEVLDLATRCAALAGTPAPDPRDLHLIDATGTGFGQVSDADRRAMRTVLDTEGILVDPTYGAKMFAALPTEAPAVLWHTGGLPWALKP